jgi:tubulin-specific chaperone D
MESMQFHAICKVLQLFCRVRGYKYIIKFFPHEVSHVEVCMLALQAQDRTDHCNWETRYILLLWMCQLCLIPFDICSLDSTLSTFTTTDDAAALSSGNLISSEEQSGQSAEQTPGVTIGEVTQQSHSQSQSRLVCDIIALSREHLSESGPTREAAYACLSALFTRPDMESTLLRDFMCWCCAQLQAWGAKGEEAEQELNRESFQLIGLLHTMSNIFKKGHRNNVLPYANMALGPCLLLSEQNNQTLVRKLLIKVIQRIGLIFLPPREAAWRYQRGSRSLLTNLNQTSSSASATATAGSARDNDEDEEEEEEVEVPPELEDIVEKVLCALQDKDTVVRWSAAKGIGRITMRLPLDFGDDIVGAVIEIFSDADNESAWHGGCLALAELSRRGLLLPSRLASVVPLVVRAMHFDLLRGQHSVGSHVRDAASYVCWAFARAYAPEVLRPFVDMFAEAMLLASLFDREVETILSVVVVAVLSCVLVMSVCLFVCLLVGVIASWFVGLFSCIS